MEKVEIKLSIDEYRMRALTFYLGKENSTVQKKMDESLRRLYEEAVPEEVREFLDAMAAPPKPKRPPRPSQPKTDTASTTPGPAGEQKGGGA